MPKRRKTRYATFEKWQPFKYELVDRRARQQSRCPSVPCLLSWPSPIKGELRLMRPTRERRAKRFRGYSPRNGEALRSKWNVPMLRSTIARMPSTKLPWSPFVRDSPWNRGNDNARLILYRWLTQWYPHLLLFLPWPCCSSSETQVALWIPISLPFPTECPRFPWETCSLGGAANKPDWCVTKHPYFREAAISQLSTPSSHLFPIISNKSFPGLAVTRPRWPPL